MDSLKTNLFTIQDVDLTIYIKISSTIKTSALIFARMDTTNNYTLYEYTSTNRCRLLSLSNPRELMNGGLFISINQLDVFDYYKFEHLKEDQYILKNQEKPKYEIIVKANHNKSQIELIQVKQLLNV